MFNMNGLHKTINGRPNRFDLWDSSPHEGEACSSALSLWMVAIVIDTIYVIINKNIQNYTKFTNLTTHINVGRIHCVIYYLFSVGHPEPIDPTALN